MLLLNTASPFYCLALGAQRLRDAVQDEALLLDRLVAAILATGRRVLPIPTVDALFGAKAALEELETAASGRSEGFRDISKVPSYQRFSSNIQSFLDGPAQNVKANGQVVETPQQARTAIPPLLRQLALAHTELRARTAQLANGINDFTQLNLPALVASGAIARARQVIGEHAARLDAQGADERLLSVRDVTLDVLAAKAVVTQFGSFSGPSTFYRVLGVGGPYADGSHPAVPASVITDVHDQVVLGTSVDDAAAGRLFFLVDGLGGPPIEINLDPSPMGDVNISSSSITLSVWLIGDGLSPAMPPGAAVPNNNELRIQIGATVYTVPLTLSPDDVTGRTAQEVCDDINAPDVLPLDVRAEAIFAPLEYAGPFDIDENVGSTTFHVPAGASDLVGLGVVVGHLVHVFGGPNDGLFTISGVTTTTLTVAGSFTGELGRRCEVGPPARRIRIRCTDPVTQIPARVRLALLADTEKSANAASTFGFFPGIFSTCRPTTIDELVAQFEGRTNQLVASALYTPVVEGDATSSVTNPFSVTFSEPVGTVTEYMTVRIASGPNQGDYLVDGPGALSNEVLLKTLLPVQRKGIEPVTFAASLGHKELVVSGKSQGLSAALSVTGPAAPRLYTTDPKVGYGMTPYFRLPETPRGLQPGDVLELYDANYNVPSSTFAILGVEASLKVLTVSPSLSTHLAPSPTRWVFGDQPTPFARLRVSKTYDFGVFRDRLLAWLARAVNQEAYFTEVNRQVNPLLVNETPTAAQVGAAKAAMEGLYELLTMAHAGLLGEWSTLEYALANYKVPPVAAVDVLLKSYKEKGSDRAVDLLLSGEFGTFFGLTLDEASYAGAMQSAMREVTREDLAVRSTNRADRAAPRQLSESDSPDYEFDQSDIEGGAQVDPP